MTEPIYVTKSIMPDFNSVEKKLRTLWNSRMLTNSGIHHQEFERLLEQKIGTFCSLTCNGTIALQSAIHVLGLKEEVITTPFTFAATAHVLWLCGITPVFCDIEPSTLNIDCNHIERSITNRTTGILAVHTYGNPCSIDHLSRICKEYGLKLLYDAAPCFGVEIDGIPIGKFGDISVFSFHATKIFHTFEGGCITTNDYELKERVDLFKNFGYKTQEEILTPGINGKMNEYQAIIGIENLKIVNEEIRRRKKIFESYLSLNSIPGIRVIQSKENVKYNYGYCPIIVNEQQFGKTRNDIHEELKKHNIFTRKYFYPLCSNYSCYSHLNSSKPKNLKIANWVADRILCLPIYGDLSEDKVLSICNILKKLKQ